ncbi:hypothetical protein PV11_02461 [Exophiala sideris]|uniref:Oxidoreductase-like domain-containing protein n=1 Tax=Exophiala sideris TaxID=1016849 RepID=A0A0D1YZ97_9EURO|nr:hypothetical protein PV11_02461 [Exophiala sideris]
MAATLVKRTWTCATCLRQQLLLQECQLPSRTRVNYNTRPPSSEWRRSFHLTGAARREQLDPQRQAVPLGDFYTDLLSSPLPETTHEDSPLPDFVPTGGDQSKEERARRLFGSIQGSGYQRTVSDTPDATWRTINGVPVPPRPAEPDNCCMSGCVHCVWDDYRDDVEAWAARVHEAQSKSPGRTTEDPKIQLARPEVHEASGSMDDDGGGSESLWTTPSSSDNEEDILFAGIPVGIREFMATEKRIRDRKRARHESGR